MISFLFSKGGPWVAILCLLTWQPPAGLGLSVLESGQTSSSPLPPTNGHSLAGSSPGLVVKTSSGLVRGLKDRNVLKWLGIPYASPPTKQFRFHDPLPMSPWRGVRDAVSLPPACAQSQVSPITPLLINTTNTEDCLYLSVYVPESVSQTEHQKVKPQHEGHLLPVLIWLHSGGFFSGTNAQIEPSRLVTEGNIIVVTVQYRLGIFGFLSLEGQFEGNQGIKDQMLALEWVSRNINMFGGDSNLITLMGTEAGAVSSSILLRNPKLSALVSGAILHSAGPLSPMGLGSRIDASNHAEAVGKKLNCSFSSTKDLSACLSKSSAEDLLNAEHQLCSAKLEETCFGPVIDDNIVTQPRPNTTEITNGKPVLMGTNSNEGFLKLMKFLTKEYPTEKLHTEGFSQEMYEMMIAKMFHKFNNKSHDVIEFLYSSGDYDYSPTKASARFLALEKMVGDYLYKCGQDFTEEHEIPNLYRYSFTWNPSTDLWPTWSGVKQGAELTFLLGEPLGQNEEESEPMFLEEEKLFSRQMIKYWSNFVKFGSPNGPADNSTEDGLIAWPRFVPGTMLELELNAIDSKQIQTPHTHTLRCRLWNQLVKKLNIPDTKKDQSKNKCPDHEPTAISEKPPTKSTTDVPFRVPKSHTMPAFRRSVRGLSRGSSGRKIGRKIMYKRQRQHAKNNSSSSHHDVDEDVNRFSAAVIKPDKTLMTINETLNKIKQHRGSKPKLLKSGRKNKERGSKPDLLKSILLAKNAAESAEEDEPVVEAGLSDAVKHVVSTPTAPSVAHRPTGRTLAYKDSYHYLNQLTSTSVPSVRQMTRNGHGKAFTSFNELSSYSYSGRDQPRPWALAPQVSPSQEDPESDVIMGRPVPGSPGSDGGIEVRTRSSSGGQRAYTIQQDIKEYAFLKKMQAERDEMLKSAVLRQPYSAGWPPIMRQDKEFPSRENNSQISYQLSVDLNSSDGEDSGTEGEGDGWRVYDTRNQGNSPIYVSSDSGLHDSDAGFEADSVREYDSAPQRTGGNRPDTTTPPIYSRPRYTTTEMAGKGDRRGSYDPFYPNFGGFDRSHATTEAVDVQDDHPYFPH